MPRPRSTMRKIREVLRLTFAERLSRRRVGQTVGLPTTTVYDYVKRAEAAGLTWPLPSKMDDAELQGRLFVSEAKAVEQRPWPDWQRVHLELRRKGVTLQLLHMEYKEQHPNGFQYTWFTQHYRETGSHRIEGIGIGFIPPLWQPDEVDAIAQVTTEEAMAMARRLATEEAIFAGTSTGANVVAALREAERLGPMATVVTIVVDSGKVSEHRPLRVLNLSGSHGRQQRTGI